MKFRPFIILLLFVMSLGILAWMYHTASHGHDRLQDSPWREVLLDLREYSHTKHIKSTQYARFAEIAKAESEQNAAQLFRALALSEHIHEQNCLEAIKRLGGKPAPLDTVIVFEGKTADNLVRSLAFERQLHQDRRDSHIDRALQSGNRYAARILIWAEGADIQHICLMQHCIGAPDSLQSYVVCPQCGNIYPADMAAHYCPFCLTGEAEYIHPQ